MPKKPLPPPVDKLPVPVELIERRIYLIRSHKVMLDSDLAELYQVETRVLVQAVKRNLDRFPEDFMLQLTREEIESLRSQSVISKPGRGGRTPRQSHRLENYSCFAANERSHPSDSCRRRRHTLI